MRWRRKVPIEIPPAVPAPTFRCRKYGCTFPTGFGSQCCIVGFCQADTLTPAAYLKLMQDLGLDIPTLIATEPVAEHKLGGLHE